MSQLKMLENKLSYFNNHRVIISIAVIVVLIFIGVFFANNSVVKISANNPARKLIERIEAGEAIRFDGKVKVERNGKVLSGKMTLAESEAEKLFYMKQVLDVNGSQVEMIVFYDNDKTTMITPLLETIALGTRSLDVYKDKDVKIEEGVESINGRTMPYISYVEKEATCKYFIDGDRIFALEMKKQTGSDNMILIIDSYSSDIPDEFFQIPSEYANYHVVDNR